MTKPDELDWKIIHRLEQNGRTSNAGIAEKLNVAEGTVRSRIKKLVATGILKIAGRINPEFLEGHQLVIIAMTVKESRQLERTARAISKLPEVREVAITSGRYDIMAKVVVDSNRGIIQFLSKSLAKINTITATETFVFLKTFNCWV